MNLSIVALKRYFLFFFSCYTLNPEELAKCFYKVPATTNKPKEKHFPEIVYCSLLYSF